MLKKQEEQLVIAFRSMHPEDRSVLLDFAQKRADENLARRPSLSLVASNPGPSGFAAFGGGPGEVEHVLAPSR